MNELRQESIGVSVSAGWTKTICTLLNCNLGFVYVGIVKTGPEIHNWNVLFDYVSIFIILDLPVVQSNSLNVF